MSNTIVHRFISTTPPITRVLVGLTIITSLCVYFDFLKPQTISYSRFYLADLQFYRMFTSFFYYGRASFELIMNFIFLYRYSSMLEESYNKRSDYFFTLVLIFLALIISSTIVYMPFLATPLSNTITYIWSRKNPQGIVQIFGFVSFSAFFLPFVFPLISLIFEGRIPKEELVGILVGQIVYYLKDVYPKFGKDYFKTPCWIHFLFREKCENCSKATTKPKPGRKVGDFTKTINNTDQENDKEELPYNKSEAESKKNENNTLEANSELNSTIKNNVDDENAFKASTIQDTISSKIDSTLHPNTSFLKDEAEKSLSDIQQAMTTSQKGEMIIDSSKIIQELHDIDDPSLYNQMNYDKHLKNSNEQSNKGEVKTITDVEQSSASKDDFFEVQIGKKPEDRSSNEDEIQLDTSDEFESIKLDESNEENAVQNENEDSNGNQNETLQGQNDFNVSSKSLSEEIDDFENYSEFEDNDFASESNQLDENAEGSQLNENDFASESNQLDENEFVSESNQLDENDFVSESVEGNQSDGNAKSNQLNENAEDSQFDENDFASESNQLDENDFVSESVESNQSDQSVENEYTKAKNDKNIHSDEDDFEINNKATSSKQVYNDSSIKNMPQSHHNAMPFSTIHDHQPINDKSHDKEIDQDSWESL